MSSPTIPSDNSPPHDHSFSSVPWDPPKLCTPQHDYYKLLNIKKNASSDEIAASLSTTLDRYKNRRDSCTIDAQIRLAHGVLSNPVLKKYYDDAQDVVELGAMKPECNPTYDESESYEPIKIFSQYGDGDSVDDRLGLKEGKDHNDISREDAVQRVEETGDDVDGFSNITAYDIGKSVLSRKRKHKQSRCRFSRPSAPVHDNTNEEIDNENVPQYTARKAHKKTPVKKWGVKQKQPLSVTPDLSEDSVDDATAPLKRANVSGNNDTLP